MKLQEIKDKLKFAWGNVTWIDGVIALPMLATLAWSIYKHF